MQKIRARTSMAGLQLARKLGGNRLGSGNPSLNPIECTLDTGGGPRHPGPKNRRAVKLLNDLFVLMLLLL